MLKKTTTTLDLLSIKYPNIEITKQNSVHTYLPYYLYFIYAIKPKE